MDSDRSPKRRKLNTPTKLPTQSSAAAKLAELRQSRSASKLQQDPLQTLANGDTESTGPEKALERDTIQVSAANREQPNGASTAPKRTPGRQSATKSALEDRSKEGTEAYGMNGHAEVVTPSRSTTKTQGSRTKKQKDAVEDVEMQDAEDVIRVAPAVANQDGQDEDDVDTPRRTTGRRRQPSKKLQESIGSATPEPATKRRTPRSVKTGSAQPSPKPSEELQTAAAENGVAPTLKRRRKLSDLSQHIIQPSTEVEPALVEAAATPLLDPPTVEKPKRTPRSRVKPKKDGVPGRTPIDVEVEIATEQPPAVSVEVEEPAIVPVAVSRSNTEAPTTEDDKEVQPFDESASIPAEHLEMLQTLILQRVTRQVPYQLSGLSDEYAKIESLMQQTILAGESNSLMVIGARGSGKSAIVENIVQDQRLKHGDDFHVVRLNGFIHTDDKIALRDIWHQLGREMEMEDDMLVKNYADTLTTLLALLSHPADMGQETTGMTAKSIIFILDEFDLFASHPRQTLLYNLFDIAQSRKAPIAVLGLTTRLDVAESLEKRVKSRFSHRSVYLPLAKNFAIFRLSCQSILTIPSSSTTDHLGPSLPAWNSTIRTLFDTQPAFTAHLQKIYTTTKSIPDFQTSMLLPLSTLPATNTTTADLLSHLTNTLANAPSLLPPDNRLTLLSSLSTLALSLLIAAARLSIIHDTETCTFALAYDEYKSLASKARITASASGALATGSGARVWSQSSAAGAWEGLIDAGLVLAMSERRTGDASKGLCRVDVSLEELGACADNGEVEMSAVLGKWCKEI
ncbi:hypothetical protein MBLNU457_6543t1 [Dothideomycetes sp. NU457]